MKGWSGLRPQHRLMRSPYPQARGRDLSWARAQYHAMAPSRPEVEGWGFSPGGGAAFSGVPTGVSKTSWRTEATDQVVTKVAPLDHCFGVGALESQVWTLVLKSSITITTVEPWVTLNMAGRKTKFLMDTRVPYSVLTHPDGSLSSASCTVTGTDGQPKVRQFTFPLTCKIGSKAITYSFLYVPECPLPLMVHDLLSKLGASVSLQGNAIQVSVPPEKGIHLLALLAPEDQKLPPVLEKILI
nr:uncharacterized protein LOC129019690 [Pongo pygmaeus]